MKLKHLLTKLILMIFKGKKLRLIFKLILIIKILFELILMDLNYKRELLIIGNNYIPINLIILE